ncbi:hypothetical protein AB6A23_21160 [Paenibacillus tarimensis]
MTNASKTRLQTKAKLALALVLAVSIATACTAGEGTGNENLPSAINNGSGANTENNQNDNPSAIMDPDSAVPDEETPPANSEPKEDHSILSAEGTFNGQIDSHSVELSTKDGIAAFQHDEDLNDALSKLQKDAKVHYTYTEKLVEADGQTIKQLWLVSIETAS